MARLFPPDSVCIVRIRAQLEHLKKIKAGHIFKGHVPTLEPRQLSNFIETAFWAGLRSNEGRTTRVRLAIAAPEHLPETTVFGAEVDYSESEIARLAPAVAPTGCLGVTLGEGGFRIWGFAPRRALLIAPVETIVLGLSEPGTVRVDIGPFQPYAVLNGRSDDIVAASSGDLAHYLQLKLAKSLSNDDILETQAVWRECLALVELVRAILGDGHGGTVLFVPNKAGDWTSSLDPFAYRLKHPDPSVRQIIRKELSDANGAGQAMRELAEAPLREDQKARIIAGFPTNPGWGAERAAIRAMAPLAAVDGAIVMTTDLQLLGFGAKIVFKAASEVPVCRFTAKASEQKVEPSHLEEVGGMRHQSAARFVSENKDCFAIVVSQDRRVSLMNWDTSLDSVAVMRDAEWWV